MIRRASLLWLLILSTSSRAEERESISHDFAKIRYTKNEVKKLLDNFTNMIPDMISKGRDFFVSHDKDGEDNYQKFRTHFSVALKFEVVAQVSGIHFLLPPNTDTGNKTRRDIAVRLLATQIMDRTPFPKAVEFIGRLIYEELQRRKNEHPLLVANMIQEILRETVSGRAIPNFHDDTTQIPMNIFTLLSNTSNATRETENDFYFSLDDLMHNGVNETKIDRFFEIISPVKNVVEETSAIFELMNRIRIKEQIDGEEEESREEDKVTCILNFTYWMSLIVIAFILGFIVRNVLDSCRSKSEEETEMKTYVPVNTKANA